MTYGVNSWVVVQWDTHLFKLVPGAGDSRKFQIWIGVNGTEDITYSYDLDTIGKDAPADPGLRVGAESIHGIAGTQIDGPPTSSYVVNSTAPTPGGVLSYTLAVKGTTRGNHRLTTSVVSDIVAGSTNVVTPIVVTRR